MNQYLAEITLPEVLSTDFVAKIPNQREFVFKKMAEGLIFSYSLSMESRKLYVFIGCEEKYEAKVLLSNMPLFEYFEDFKVSELTFHMVNNVTIPNLSFSEN